MGCGIGYAECAAAHPLFASFFWDWPGFVMNKSKKIYFMTARQYFFEGAIKQYSFWPIRWEFNNHRLWKNFSVYSEKQLLKLHISNIYLMILDNVYMSDHVTTFWLKS